MVSSMAMTRMLRLLPPSWSIPLLLSGLSIGCIPGMHVRAVVGADQESVQEAIDEGTALLRPLAGASVSMLCPQLIKPTSQSLLGTTDARGELDFEEPPFGRWIHDGCDLVVEKAGYRTRHVAVAEVCAEYSVNHCVRAIFTVELHPSSSKAQADIPAPDQSRSRSPL